MINLHDIELLEQLAIAEARESFWAYRQYMNPALKIGWWQREVATVLQQFYDELVTGQRPMCVIQAPPQHGKSLQIIDFIAWLAGKNPDLRTIYTSFSERLGIRANLRMQRTLDSGKYKKAFPDTHLNASNMVTISNQSLRNREILEYVGREGYFRNTTVRGAITGETLDLGVIDDPIKGRAEAGSQTVRDACWDWFTDDFFTRFSEGAGMLAILTRWHEDDPIGRLVEREPRLKVYSYPALATHKEKHRDIGDPLFPELKSLEFLEGRREVMAPGHWESLYQQNPRPMEGSLFRQQDILVDGKPVPIPKTCDYVFAVIDSALKAGDRNDGTAVVYFARNRFVGHPLVILDWDIVQIESDLISQWFPSVMQRLSDLAGIAHARMGSAGAFVEDKGSGITLLQRAARNGWPAQAIDSKLTAMSKDARGTAVSDFVCSGMVKISEPAYNKAVSYKGREQNHFLSQVFGYQIGVPNQSDDLWDVFVYGISIALGDSNGI